MSKQSSEINIEKYSYMFMYTFTYDDILYIDVMYIKKWMRVEGAYEKETDDPKAGA